MATVLLCLGSNLGNKEEQLGLATQQLASHPQIQLSRRSPIWTTDPMDYLEQPEFANQVIEIQTDLEPMELLDICQATEESMGRIFRFDKGPREIDIDILTYDNQSIESERLMIPHHSIESRSFVIELIERLESYSS